MEKINIGIIDDTQSKITAIKNTKYTISRNVSGDKKSIFENTQINYITLDIKKEKKEVLQQIYDNKLSCVIVDYNLSSVSGIDYDGTELATFINDSIVEFPVFLLTSYESDLFANTTFNSYQVFDFERYNTEPKETIEFTYKMIQQIKNYKNKLVLWKKRLLELLELKGNSAEIDDEIVELNRKIISSIEKTDYSLRTEKTIVSDKMDEFLNKIEKLMENL